MRVWFYATYKKKTEREETKVAMHATKEEFLQVCCI